MQLLDLHLAQTANFSPLAASSNTLTASCSLRGHSPTLRGGPRSSNERTSGQPRVCELQTTVCNSQSKAASPCCFLRFLLLIVCRPLCVALLRPQLFSPFGSTARLLPLPSGRRTLSAVVTSNWTTGQSRPVGRCSHFGLCLPLLSSSAPSESIATARRRSVIELRIASCEWPVASSVRPQLACVSLAQWPPTSFPGVQLQCSIELAAKRRERQSQVHALSAFC